MVAQPLTTNFDVVKGLVKGWATKHIKTYQNISNNYYSFVATTSVVRYLVITVVAICPHDSRHCPHAIPDCPSLPIEVECCPQLLLQDGLPTIMCNHTCAITHMQRSKEAERERGQGGVGEREGTLVRTALALLVALSRLRQVRCQLQQRPAALRECRSPTSGGAKATPAPIVGWRSWRIGAVGLQARSPTVAVPFASIWQIQLPILNISTEPNQSAKTGTCC